MRLALASVVSLRAPSTSSVPWKRVSGVVVVAFFTTHRLPVTTVESVRSNAAGALVAACDLCTEGMSYTDLGMTLITNPALEPDIRMVQKAAGAEHLKTATANKIKVTSVAAVRIFGC